MKKYIFLGLLIVSFNSALAMFPRQIPEVRQAQDARPAQGERRSLSSILGQAAALPWTIGGSITDYLNRYAVQMDSSANIFKRALIEGILFGVLMGVAFGDVVTNAANSRHTLGRFAWEDLFALQPSHYNLSRAWIAFSGLWYYGVFLGLRGIQLSSWFFGTIIGIRCAYDSVIRLPISFFTSKPEQRRDSRLPFLFGNE